MVNAEAVTDSWIINELKSNALNLFTVWTEASEFCIRECVIEYCKNAEKKVILNIKQVSKVLYAVDLSDVIERANIK